MKHYRAQTAAKTSHSQSVNRNFSKREILMHHVAAKNAEIRKRHRETTADLDDSNLYILINPNNNYFLFFSSSLFIISITISS